MDFPDTEQKVRQRISRYRSSVDEEKRDYRFISDGAGKRYLLFSLYFLLGDLKKTAEYYQWYESEFPDDVKEPFQLICWALDLFRMGKEEQAKRKLAQAMLSNLYLIPSILGRQVDEYDMWHSSSDGNIDYVQYLPLQVREEIRLSEIEWLTELYDSLEFKRLRKRRISIYRDRLSLSSKHQTITHQDYGYFVKYPFSHQYRTVVPGRA